LHRGRRQGQRLLRQVPGLTNGGNTMRIALIAAALAAGVSAALAASAAAQAPNAAPTPAPQAPSAAPQPLRCPDSIQVAEQATAPAGFTAEAGNSEHRFLQVAFFEGQQSDRSASLAPDSDNRRGRVVTQVFGFPMPRNRPVYALCRYRDTAAVLLVDVPTTVTRCTLTFAYNQRTGAVGTA